MAQTLKDFQSLLRAGRMGDAAKVVDQLASAPKADAKVLSIAADFFYRRMQHAPKATAFVARAVKKKQKDPDIHALAAEIYLFADQISPARDHAKTALALAPKALNVLVVNAAVRVAGNQFDAALPFVEKALSVDPTHLGAKYQLIRILITQGKIKETLELVQTILTEMPDAIEVISIYVTAADLQKDDPILQRMRDEILPRFLKSNHPRTGQLLYNMGKAHDAVGEYDAAFDYYTRAKQRSPQRYNPERYRAFVNNLCTNISRADYFQRGGGAEEPVLIVGMPRSGSTLLEQVLAGHPDIASAGESISLRRLVRSVKLDPYDGPRMVKAIKQMPADAAKGLGRRYLQETGHGRALRIVDKNLHNFELLGFLSVMFPKAKILNMQRDPLDNCVACYLQKLPASHEYTETLAAMGHSYLQYVRLMNHWKTVLPNPIMTVRYEDLVTDLEGSARKVVDFIGLDWNDACLDYQSSDNKVNTISVAQVRKPLYTSSMQRWRRYEAHIEPLKRQLSPLYPDGFDQPAKLD